MSRAVNPHPVCRTVEVDIRARYGQGPALEPRQPAGNGHERLRRVDAGGLQTVAADHDRPLARPSGLRLQELHVVFDLQLGHRGLWPAQRHPRLEQTTDDLEALHGLRLRRGRCRRRVCSPAGYQGTRGRRQGQANRLCHGQSGVHQVAEGRIACCRRSLARAGVVEPDLQIFHRAEQLRRVDVDVVAGPHAIGPRGRRVFPSRRPFQQPEENLPRLKLAHARKRQLRAAGQRDDLVPLVGKDAHLVLPHGFQLLIGPRVALAMEGAGPLGHHAAKMPRPRGGRFVVQAAGVNFVRALLQKDLLAAVHRQRVGLQAILDPLAPGDDPFAGGREHGRSAAGLDPPQRQVERAGRVGFGGRLRRGALRPRDEVQREQLAGELIGRAIGIGFHDFHAVVEGGHVPHHVEVEGAAAGDLDRHALRLSGCRCGRLPHVEMQPFDVTQLEGFDAGDIRTRWFFARQRLAGQELDEHVVAAAEVGAPVKLDRARRGHGLFGELQVAGGRHQQIIFRAGLFPLAADGHGALQLPTHQPAELGLAQIERPVEAEHRAVGHFENDRLTAALHFVVGRRAEHHGAVGNPYLAVLLILVAVQQQLGIVRFALHDHRVVQLPTAGRKQPAKLLELLLHQLPACGALLLRDALRVVGVDRRLDPAHHEQRVQPIGDHHDRKTAGDANHALHGQKGARGQGLGTRGGQTILNAWLQSLAPSP